MNQQTIHIQPQERPRFDFLQVQNHLSEFKTEIDKAIVRQNLGIGDEYSLLWENITGPISNNQQLQSYIESLINSHINQSSELSTMRTNIQKAQANINTANAALTQQGLDQSKLEEKIYEISELIDELSSFQKDLRDLQTNVAQNSANIAQNAAHLNELGLSDFSEISNKADEAKSEAEQNRSDIRSITSQIAVISQQLQQVQSNKDNITLLSNGVNTNSSAINSIQSQLEQNNLYSLNDKISELSLKVGILEGMLGTITLINITANTEITGTINNDPIQIIVTGHYSNGSEKTIENFSVQSSDSTVVQYNDSTRSVTLLKQGSATLTVIVEGKTCQIPVRVLTSQQLQKQYIGLATDYTNVTRSAGFETIDGIWNQENLPMLYEGDDIYYLWIITTYNIQQLQELGSINPNDVYQGTCELNDHTYNIYKVGEFQGPIEGYSIKITV